jgi:hypothetical protein
VVFFGKKGLVDCLNDVWKLSLTDLSWGQALVRSGQVPLVRQNFLQEVFYQVTVTNVVYTINYLFKDGPAPCRPSAR